MYTKTFTRRINGRVYAVTVGVDEDVARRCEHGSPSTIRWVSHHVNDYFDSIERYNNKGER